MNDITPWIVQLRKGVLELIIVRLLAQQSEMHGYAIVKELHSLGKLVAGESTVYPVLKRLEADGLLTSRWVEAQSGPPRKYYRISAKGTRFMNDAGAEWDALVHAMNCLKG
jgi:PadR family transcriptional regulator, regulatory protein PadR